MAILTLKGRKEAGEGTAPGQGQARQP